MEEIGVPIIPGTLSPLSNDEILLNIDGRIFNAIVNSNSGSYSVFENGKFFEENF